MSKNLTGNATRSEAVQQRAAWIVDQKTAGRSYNQIAEDLGLSVAYVHKLYKQTLERIPVEKVEDHRKTENLKLDRLEREANAFRDMVTPLVSAGKIIRDARRDGEGNVLLTDDGKPIMDVIRDLSPWMKSIDQRLKIASRRAALNGLDMPTKVALTDPTGENEAKLVQFYLPENGRD